MRETPDTDRISAKSGIDFRTFVSPFFPSGLIFPEWFMGPVHVSPADAVRAHEELGAATSIAIHFGTFHLADDAETQPARRIAEKPLHHASK